MLNSVVLPAPFGPMTAKISPCATSKLTRVDRDAARESACDTPSIARNALMAAAPAPSRAREPRPDAVGQRDDHDQQADAVEHLLGAGHIEAERVQHLGHGFGQAGEHERAEDRPEQCADAADDRRRG